MTDAQQILGEQPNRRAIAAHAVPISIRPLTATDLRLNALALADLLIEVVHGGSPMGFVAPMSREQARDYWLSLRREVHVGRRIVLVAYEDGRIVGSGQLEIPKWPNARHRAELQKLFVGSGARGRGVGTLLVVGLHGAARDRGRSLILLGARRGAPAEGFYRTLGYQEVGVIPGYGVGADGKRYDRVSFYRELR